MKKFSTHIVRVESLSIADRREMFELFEKYYDDVELERFLADLAEKTHVFIFRNRASLQLVGFSTIFRRALPEIAPGLFLFSGDTVLKEECWGSKILQRCFFRFIVESKLKTPVRPLYWMLMSKGFKTYMMMRMNFVRSYPNPLGPTPSDFQEVRDHFYAKKFGKSYDPKTGLITFDHALGSVKEGIAQPTAKQLKDPEVAYFLKVNPEHDEGVELACVSEIQFSDFMLHIPKFFLKLKTKKKKRTAHAPH